MGSECPVLEKYNEKDKETHTKTFPFLLLSVQMELTCVWFFAVLDGVLGSVRYLVVKYWKVSRIE